MTVKDTGPVPVMVLTGFLGAGKTTLLNGLLRLPAFRDHAPAGIAVIVNEFGEIGIDHLLVDRVDGDMLMLTTGCLCCAARGDLVNALASLFERRRSGQVRFERVIIETTGLADPGPIINALLPTPDLGAACRLDRVLTLVDALDGASILDRMEEARRQVALADVLVLSKRDLLPPGDCLSGPALEARLDVLNPAAPIIGGCDPETVLAALLAFPVGLGKAAVEPYHGHGHLMGIGSVILRAGRVDPQRFEGFLDALLARHGADILRLKGLLAAASDPERPVLVNVVQHRIHPASRLDAWPDEDRGTRLVVIAKSTAVTQIVRLWDAVFGPPRIDQPDAAALSLEFESRPGLF